MPPVFHGRRTVETADNVDKLFCGGSASPARRQGAGRQAARRGRVKEEGSVSIEGIVLVPLVFVVLLLITEASLWVYASSVAQAAAEDGARASVGVDASSSAQGLETARQILEQRSAALDDWELSASQTATTVTVRVSGHSPSVIPGLKLDVVESATLPWELPR